MIADRARDQGGGGERHTGVPQQAGEASQSAEQRECAHAGEPGLRAVGVPRPLPLHTDSGAAESGDQQSEDISRGDHSYSAYVAGRHLMSTERSNEPRGEVDTR